MKKSVSLGALALGLLITSCGGNAGQGDGAVAPQAGTGGEAPAFNLLTIAKTQGLTEDSYSATIRGKQDIEILPQVSGTLWKLHVTEGQAVKRGQTLFTIDPVPYQAATEQAKANVVAAESAVATAQLSYEANQKLFAEGIISEIALRTSENSLSSAKASLAQARASLVNARNSLSYTTVTSPANGIVGTLPLRQGALVGPSMGKALTTISDNAEMYVYFSISENQLLELNRQYGSLDAAVRGMDSVELRLSDGSIYPQKGKVESVSGVIDRSTGSVSLRANFPNPDRLLLSGSTGKVLVPHVHKDAIIIPQSATYRLQDKIFVYKVVEGKAKSEIITIGASTANEYIVTSGLSVGDVIVADGVGILREGTPIQ